MFAARAVTRSAPMNWIIKVSLVNNSGYLDTYERRGGHVGHTEDEGEATGITGLERPNHRF